MMKRSSLLNRITFALGAIALVGCDGTSVVGGGGNTGGASGASSGTTPGATTTSGGPAGAGGGSTGPVVDKVDILIEVDNSRSMADKQEVLSVALSDLVQSLSNPPCVDGSGSPIAAQPVSGLDACPAGSTRVYAPIRDIHVGVISSSLGSHGADSCSPSELVGPACPNPTLPNPSNDDHGHLLTRTDACGGGTVPTYQGAGFLAWDPEGKANPPGDSDIIGFTTKLKTLVLGAGQIGCGFESQLESWYRFLVDPNPYDSIVIDSKGAAVPVSTDTALLQQRAAFLRPDSLVAILMLTDENDCSIKDGGIAYYAGQVKVPGDNTRFYHFPRARHECATNPDDVCCRSCTADQTGCPVDPACIDPTKEFLTAEEDPTNLRCWDQKRRFGFDFLQPIDRYRAALQDDQIADRDGNMVQNPLFAHGRDHSLVVFAGIVGVPWQDIARNPMDLTAGFKSAEELSVAQNGKSRWDVILGDPSKNVPPASPFMVESPTARTGTDPVTGAMISLPTSSTGNPINGHEYTTGSYGDLEYACVFPLVTPRVCDPTSAACDCTSPTTDNPLCDANNPTTQVRAKAYPGRRELDLLKHLGSQGVTASICPSQQVDATRADFAYRPAIRALVERIRPHLPTSP